MLGPFRIRNLKPYHQTPLPHTERLSACEAVVSLTGTEYQSNVDAHPDSRLKYIDEDDGETVTVGSSAELASRLQDVIPKRVRRVSASYHKSFGKVSTELSRPPSPAMHVFEIDRTTDSVQIWQDIEQRYKDMTAGSDQLPVQCQVKPMKDSGSGLERRGDNDMEVHCDPSDDAARLQEMQEEDRVARSKAPVDPKIIDESARSFHFARSDPPQVPSRHKTKRSDEDSLARYHKWGDSMMDKVSLALPKAPITTPSLPNVPPYPSSIPGDDKLTPEGQRQAIEAGALLRMRNHKTWYPSPAPLPGQKPSNRWASYGKTQSSMVPNFVPVKSFKPIDAPEVGSSTKPASKVEQPAPLLQMFREELAKISKPIDTLSKNAEWKNVCKKSDAANVQMESISASGQKKLQKPSSKVELVNIIEQLVSGVHGLATDAQTRFDSIANNVDIVAERKQGLICQDALAAILKDFRDVSSVALEDGRKAVSSAAVSGTRELDISTCQTLVKSLKDLSKGIDTFVTLLTATVIIPQPEKSPAPKSQFPNEPCEIEIGNIPDSASQEQVRSLVLRALSIDGLFSGRLSDILSIRIVPATWEKPRIAQVRLGSHEVAIRVITHFKDSQFGGKQLSATVPGELKRCEKNEETSDGQEKSKDLKSFHDGFNDFLSQRSEPTQAPALPLPPNLQTTSTDKPNESASNAKQIDTIQSTRAKSNGPSVRFADLPPVPGKRPISFTALPGAVNVPRGEPIINFRHVPSSMPRETFGRRRSYQFTRSPSFKSQPGASQYTDDTSYCDPSPHLAWPSEGRSDSARDNMHLQKTSKEESEVSANKPSLEGIVRSRDFTGRDGASLPQPNKETLKPKLDQPTAEKENIVCQAPRRFWQRPMSNPGDGCWQNDPFFRPTPANRPVAPDSSTSLAKKYTQNRTSTLLSMDENTPASGIPFCRFPLHSQQSIPKAPSGCWNPSNVKLYHERHNGVPPTSTDSLGAANAAFGNSGRGYPEPMDTKNLRHSMSLGAIRKPNPTSFGNFGGLGLPARPDAGRDRISGQTRAPNLFLNKAGSLKASENDKPASPEGAKPNVEAVKLTLANNVDYLTGAADVPESLAPSVPVLEQTRFPTLEQFEERASAVSLTNVTLGFPPLPSMEPLTPVLPKTFEPNTQEGNKQRWTSQSKVGEKSVCAPLFNAPGASPISKEPTNGEAPPSDDAFESPVKPSINSSSEDKQINESSGAFFSRMTGINTSSDNVFDSPKRSTLTDNENKLASSKGEQPVVELSTPSLGARLVRPFDPLAETAAIHRHQITDGVARSNTVAGHGDRGKMRNRRPYSEYMPRVDDHAQRGTFAELTAVLPKYRMPAGNGHISEKKRITNGEGSYIGRESFLQRMKELKARQADVANFNTPETNKVAKDEDSHLERMVALREGKVDMEKFKEVKWGSEWKEKRDAQAEYALRRRSMHNLGSSSSFAYPRAASPFMDPRPAPGLPNSLGSTTSLPPSKTVSTAFPAWTLPEPFHAPSPTPDTAPVPRPFPFLDPSTLAILSAENEIPITGTARAAPKPTRLQSKVEKCVEQLKKLGFGREEDGGLERLKIYAQDADGDVWDAVDMIEGERKAWGERAT